MIRASLIGLFVQSLFLDILGQKQVWLFLAIAFGLGAAQRAATSAARSVSSRNVGARVASGPDTDVNVGRDAGGALPSPR